MKGGSQKREVGRREQKRKKREGGVNRFCVDMERTVRCRTAPLAGS
jgi:hypothetical protein